MSPTSTAAAQFDRVADAYATSAVHAEGADLARLVKILSPAGTWDVLDVGTGAGHAALAVAPSVARVTAVDVSAKMLAVTERLCAERDITNIEVVQVDGHSLPFAAARFDGAVSRFSAHHWADPDRVVEETRRVLRPGASFVLIDSICPVPGSLDTFLNALELLRDPSHARNDRLSQWGNRFTRLGFVVRDEEEWLLELEVEAWLRRSATVPWRAEACRKLLAEAPTEARSALAIAADGSRFSIPCALIRAERR
ncbi:MAG: class I SAM-dependent methyltransferase [Chloroflexota bacterium]